VDLRACDIHRACRRIDRREALIEENIDYAERTREGSQDEKETPEECAAHEESRESEAGRCQKGEAIAGRSIQER
jgi:hypothetical protein